MPNNDDSRWHTLERIFAAAQKLSGDERIAYLAEACGDDQKLLAELNALLKADAGTELPMHAIVQQAADTLQAESMDVLIKQQFGNYQLVELLGAGGMGSVYLGRRVDKQFEHEVAVKVLPFNRAQQAFVERLRAERQVLAGLNHPNIASLLDGGETEDGIPYLVMEYVRGVPIDEYCDTHTLTIPERLNIFLQICDAVDYAHRNLVVHRDVKPSNILVTEDGVPKLLDFGIAKVLEPSAQHGNLTQAGQQLMTPKYASPEQVRGEPVSTATDIYSLGVLLYQLLCGHAPYNAKHDMPSSLARAIVEEMPSKPSTAITQTTGDADEHQAIAAARSSTYARLRRRLQGDLDNITLMALRKEPERRYLSARAMRDDIDHYLTDRPIAARADSISYRLGKFVRRNRVPVAAAAAVCIMFIGAAIQVVAQRDRAEAEATTARQVSEFLVSMLQASDPYERQTDVTTRELLDSGARQIDVELTDQPLVAARLKTTMAKAYLSLGLNDTAANLIESALSGFAASASTPQDRANGLIVFSEIENARQHFDQALGYAEEATKLLDPEDAVTTATANIAKSRALFGLDESERSRQAAQQSLTLLETRLGPEHPSTNNARAHVSFIENELGNYALARELAAHVVAWTERTYGEDDLLLAQPLHHLGRITWHQGDYRVAHEIYQRELTILESSLGPNHPGLHAVLVSLASNERKLGYAVNAKAYYERAIQVLEDSESPPLGKLASTYGALGTLIMDDGYLDEAEPLIRRGLALSEQQFGQGSAESTFRLLHLGILYRKKGDHTQGRNYLSQAVDAALSRYPESHRNVQIMRLHLGVNELEDGDTATARNILQGVVDSLLKHQGPEHPLVGQSLVELSSVDIAEERFEDADGKLIRALENYRALRDEVHPDIELIFRFRAKVHEGMGKPASAAEFIATADALRNKRQKVSAEEAQAVQAKQD